MKLKSMDPLYILAFCGLVERLINFGIFTVLVLRLQQFFHLSDQQSFILFGLFTMLSYAGLVLGGMIADRWLGLRATLLVGGVLLFFSTLFLAVSNIHQFYFGLALLVVGTALYKVSCTSLVGQLSGLNLREKEAGFIWFYSAMNVGAMLGPILYGVIAIYLGWKTCLFLSSGLMLIALLFFIKNKTIKEQLLTSARDKKFNGYTIIISTCISAFLLFEFFQDASWFMIIIFISFSLLLLLFLIKQTKKARLNILGLLGLSTFCMFFFACSFQVASSITLYIQRDIDKTFFGWQIPTPVFTALDPLFVVLMAPVLSYIWRAMARKNCEPGSAVKISIALGLASLAFIALYFSSITSIYQNHLTMLAALLIAYILLGAGEICLMPPILSAISQYTPVALKSTMMGIFYIFIAAAGYLSGLLSQLSDIPLNLAKSSSAQYGTAFLEVAFFALMAGIVLFLLKAKIQGGLTELK